MICPSSATVCSSTCLWASSWSSIEATNAEDLEVAPALRQSSALAMALSGNCDASWSCSLSNSPFCTAFHNRSNCGTLKRARANCKRLALSAALPYSSRTMDATRCASALDVSLTAALLPAFRSRFFWFAICRKDAAEDFSDSAASSSSNAFSASATASFVDAATTFSAPSGCHAVYDCGVCTKSIIPPVSSLNLCCLPFFFFVLSKDFHPPSSPCGAWPIALDGLWTGDASGGVGASACSAGLAASSVVKLLFALVAGATDSVRDSGTGGSVVEATTVRGGKADVVVTATIGAEGISDVTIMAAVAASCCSSSSCFIASRSCGVTCCSNLS
mmetsp:Transcript_3636/g.9191  ORF Transcript_3636/g.9191 Transcript_3636/m.9191 type:complete len:332 (-) Transcript_3636:862-1857(-)